MYINPIHAGAVAQAHALAVAARIQTAAVSPRRHRFQPLRWLVKWLQPDKSDSQTPDAAQLMHWTGCAGRSYVSPLDGVLVPRTPPDA
jgi:hypothetical protein